jgi:hypothetical protein
MPAEANIDSAPSRKRARDCFQADSNPDPDWALCPITQAVMADPVVVSDGHSYERAAIETWMFQCGKMFSPLTRERLSGVVTPNRTLKTAIDVYRDVSVAEGPSSLDHKNVIIN